MKTRKKLLVAGFLLINLLVSAKTYYVSTTGKDSNTGTISSPWLTWNHAFNKAIAGDTVFFRGGVYNATQTQGASEGPSGTAQNPICFFNYQNEIPILDGSNKTSMSYGVGFNRVEYINIKGLVVRNHFQLEAKNDLAGFGFTFCKNIRIENCTAHHIGVRGFYFYTCDNIYVINCDAYNCVDALTNGAHGDGYLVWDMHSTNYYQDTTAYVYFKGCRAWNCADDGWDAETEGTIIFDSCWAFISDSNFSYGINGFKLGLTDIESNNLGKRITHCIAAFEPSAGFVTNDNNCPAKLMKVYNNFAYHNNTGFKIFDTSSSDGQESKRTFKNNIAYGNTGGNLFLGGSATYTHDHNSWDIPLSLTDNDFINLDVSQLSGPRKSDGSLPDITFGNLKTGSKCIDAGTYLGLPFNGSAPDIGWFETSSGSTPVTPPVYIGSSIENSTPSRLEMTYNLTLANIVPATSAFTVRVNTVVRSVNSVAISGTRVLLTLGSPAVYGDAITVAYTKPATNPMQTPSGGQAATFSAQSVTNNVTVPLPLYQSSAIENTTPSIIEMTYNLTLANIIPTSSAFNVKVNTVVRSVNSVAISGTRVLLTLASPVVYGDVVTVAYTKPATNPLQTPPGGQAANITAQTVNNRVSPILPLYQSSAVENASPAVIVMTYNVTLANIVPATSAFNVRVNTVARTVNSVVVSGTRVLLTLASPVVFGDAVTVAYSKPATNPLQTASGGQAGTISAQAVTNKVLPVNTPPVIVVNYQSASFAGFVYEINASGSYDPNKDNLTFTWTVPGNIPVSSTTGPSIKYLGPAVSTIQKVEFTLRISDGITTQSRVVPIEIRPYKPELEVGEISNVEASTFKAPFYPYNVIDGNIGTMWSAEGENQWLLIELKHPFDIQYINIAFQPGQKRESYFDILGSIDKINWEPILIKSASCSFTGDPQAFEFPPSKSGKRFDFIKLVGKGNSGDSWNYISELKIYGYRHRNSPSYEKLPVKVYPNPAWRSVTVRINEVNLLPDFIQIVSLSGIVMLKDELDPGLRLFTIPLDLKKGKYILQLCTGSATLFSQKLIVAN